MKQILIAYGLVSLIAIAVLSVLSYGHGAGYVYVFWHDWQLQTNLWIVFIALALLSFSLHLVWLGLKRYLSREKRKAETVFDFKSLHPYEQLAVIWLLDAGRDQQAFIQNAFVQSGLLKSIIDARLYLMQEQFPEALSALSQSNAMAFELAELQRIELFLAQEDAEQALTHLEFLNQHELSPWLKDVQTAYEACLKELWGRFAILFPWLYLRSTQYGHLDQDVKKAWLKRLLIKFDQANYENLEDLKQRYLDLSDQIFSRSYDVQLLWLKLLARMPDMSEQHEHLSIYLLNQQFNSEVFYLWFQQQLLKQQPDYVDLQQHIEAWEAKYTSVPVLSFAKWHIYTALGMQEQADALLSLYPDNVLMNYLRIKSTLNGDEDLIKQLNLIFENNANFVEMKI